MPVYRAEMSLPSVEGAVATTRTMPPAPLWPVEAGTTVGSSRGSEAKSPVSV